MWSSEHRKIQEKRHKYNKSLESYFGYLKSLSSSVSDRGFGFFPKFNSKVLADLTRLNEQCKQNHIEVSYVPISDKPDEKERKELFNRDKIENCLSRLIKSDDE